MTTAPATQNEVRCDGPDCVVYFKPQGGGSRRKRFCSPSCRYKRWELDKAVNNMPPGMLRFFARMDTEQRRTLIRQLEAS